MEERGNKTIMCSVLFLDIVEYSKKSVSVQISLKDRFNGYLSVAIRDVPITDRIILDTGDGAAINFLGDVEDALKTAIHLRESLLAEGVSAAAPLLVRMGINLGPVRLVRDINGQPNIVGDGINVAQRVMGFADIAQILVSRSYYDAVSRLSPQYAGMFHYQGSRTDKHVREHEVYAIGYPSDKGAQGERPPPAFEEGSENISFVSSGLANTGERASRLKRLTGRLRDIFRQAEPKRRALYIGVATVPVVVITALVISMARHDKSVGVPGGLRGQEASALQPASSVEPAAESAGRDGVGAIPEAPKEPVKPKARKHAEGKKPKRAESQGTKEARSRAIKAQKPGAKEEAAKKTEISTSSETAGTFVSVNCRGAELFVDGTRKGRIAAAPLTVAVSPGKHTVIINHAKGISSQDIVFAAGKTVRLSPDFCNQ